MLYGWKVDPAHRFLHTINTSALQSMRSFNFHWEAGYGIYVYHELAMRRSKTEERIKEDEQKWEGICERLASASNLRNLHIKIFDRGFRLPEDKLLEPLRALSVQCFTVQLPWPVDYCGDWDVREQCLRTDEEYTFELMRPKPENQVTFLQGTIDGCPRRPWYGYRRLPWR